jgi:hypothetical protein
MIRDKERGGLGCGNASNQLIYQTIKSKYVNYRLHVSQTIGRGSSYRKRHKVVNICVTAGGGELNRNRESGLARVGARFVGNGYR